MAISPGSPPYDKKMSLELAGLNRISLAVSARLMPVSASPARKSARNRPDLQKAGGREAGDNCQLPCAIRAISAGFAAPRFSRFTATIVCASRIVTTGVAGSDDARNAPADKDFSVAGARDDPT